MTNKVFTFLSWMMLLTTLMIFTNLTIHPIYMMIILMIYNIMLCMHMSMWKSTFIFSILFFLIMISGLMIIFLYFSSLVSNEKAWKSLNLSYLILMNSIILMTMISLILYIPMMPIPSSLDLLPMITPPLMSSHSLITPLFAPPLTFMTILSMLYLLMALLLIMKMCTPKIKTMRKLM